MNNEKAIRNIAIKDPATTAVGIFDLLDAGESTRQDYKYRIKPFLNFIKDQRVNHNTFREFKRYLTGRTDFSISTKNKYLGAARVFLKELNLQGVLPVDISQNTKSFRQDRKHKIDGLNEEEIGKLTIMLRELPDTSRNTRLKAIVSLLALQGLRQVEIIRLDVRDIDFVNKTALVLGKGRDDKELVSLNPNTVKHLRNYLLANKIKDGAVFTSQSNNSRNKRLTTRAIRRLVKMTMTTLGIEKTVHGFRHFFTTMLIREYKADLCLVAEYTRHKSILTLQVYNDHIRKDADLPRFYETFKEINF